MTILKIISITAIAFAGAAASIAIYHQNQSKLRDGEILLQHQESQLLALATEHERLANLAAYAPSAATKENSNELERLHVEIETLKQQTNDLAAQVKPNFQRQLAAPLVRPKPRTPEYDEEFRKLRGNKGMEARDVSTAFQSYADDHQNMAPTSMDQLASYLAQNKRSLSGSNQFEIIFQGSLDRLKGIPPITIAVIRETQPWPGPDGGMHRAYGMAGGIGQIVASDDNFQTWEAQHVISPR